MVGSSTWSWPAKVGSVCTPSASTSSRCPAIFAGRWHLNYIYSLTIAISITGSVSLS